MTTKMKVKQIHIKHPSLGNIIVNGEIDKDISEQIGNVCEDYSKYHEYYHSQITKNEDGAFYLQNLCVIKPETINVGFMNNSKGTKNFISVITNRLASDNIMIYPSAILSVIYG